MSLVFRAPQDGIELFSKANDLISLIREIATNPKIGDTVKTITQQLTDAQSVTLQQATDAQKTIADAASATSELAAQRLEHEDLVKAALLEIKKRTDAIQDSVQNFNADKILFQKQTDQVMSNANDKLAKAQQLAKDTNTRATKLQAAENDLAAREQTYLKNVQDFENSQHASAADLTAKLADFNSRMQKLSDNEAAFDARKQKFEDALKG